MKSDFNSFIQKIRPSIKLIAGDNNTLTIAMLRKQVDPEISKYVPKIVNESFESHEQQLKAHMQDSQAKFTTASNRSNGMEIDTYLAAVQTAPVSALLDTGPQITSISASSANRLRLHCKIYKPLKLRMGNNSESKTTDEITSAEINFGNTKYLTTFRVMPKQPFDIILGSNFIVAAKINYDPVKMTINFNKKDKSDYLSMVPSNVKVTEWAPLVLAVGALDFFPATDPEIPEILRDVAEFFNPTPSVIKTDFPHQLRLKTDQRIRAIMRRYSPEEKIILRNHIKELYQAGYARPSSSPYSANPVIVPKSDGSAQVVINFRPLKKINVRD
ncbi:hypothetical protein AYI68_g317 [Smittium mucronatum]|uniref:Uncharacterized protein n=1 Tax=Smittium mucronatum TaxID=133383 RepID=A0A1R0H8Q4_9FUNG|nr:hypothetical protein AYI68_g317 [Smittium mucronatum]